MGRGLNYWTGFVMASYLLARYCRTLDPLSGIGYFAGASGGYAQVESPNCAAMGLVE